MRAEAFDPDGLQIVMDQNSDRQWAIEFNVTMAHIPCKYASVDIADLHGLVNCCLPTAAPSCHLSLAQPAAATQPLPTRCSTI